MISQWLFVVIILNLLTTLLTKGIEKILEFKTKYTFKSDFPPFIEQSNRSDQQPIHPDFHCLHSFGATAPSQAGSESPYPTPAYNRITPILIPLRLLSSSFFYTSNDPDLITTCSNISEKHSSYTYPHIYVNFPIFHETEESKFLTQNSWHSFQIAFPSILESFQKLYAESSFSYPIPAYILYLAKS